MVAGSRSCSVPKSSRVNAITSKCPPEKIPFWIKEEENSALSRDPPDYSRGGAPPRQGDGREDGAARGFHLSLAELPRQEGSPMYQPSSLAYRRDRSAARDARVTYCATAIPEV
jgi:hypothetical protein